MAGIRTWCLQNVTTTATPTKDYLCRSCSVLYLTNYEFRIDLAWQVLPEWPEGLLWKVVRIFFSSWVKPGFWVRLHLGLASKASKNQFSVENSATGRKNKKLFAESIRNKRSLDTLIGMICALIITKNSSTNSRGQYKSLKFLSGCC